VDELNGRVAFVTGASRGIGAAVSRRLSAAGVALGLASRSGADLGLPDTVAEPVDVRDAAALTAFAARTVERFGGIDIVVANAGVGAYGPFEEIELEHLEEMIDVNLKGTLYTARATVPHLLRSEAADFVALASEAGRRGLPGEAVYCASKFGQVGFTRALEGELRQRGVRCTSVCPGGVRTDFAMGTGRTPDLPILHDMMSAEDVADVVMHVLTRPRHMRILETAMRPMAEASWG
jgi:3-oxoacyl-[acyl-carrier protein] reductase